jgi:hypothetical protein
LFRWKGSRGFRNRGSRSCKVRGSLRSFVSISTQIRLIEKIFGSTPNLSTLPSDGSAGTDSTAYGARKGADPQTHLSYPSGELFPTKNLSFGKG